VSANDHDTTALAAFSFLSEVLMSAEAVLNQTENQTPIEVGLPKVGYSMKEACGITGLGKSTLWEAVGDGTLKCFKVGRRTLFSLKHLEDFMALYDTAGQSAGLRRKRKRKG
jgi:excisionase family DNA binding protein